MPAPEPVRAEAERLLWRYVVEVVERFGLCPWSRRARERGEVRVEVLTSTSALGAAVARIATDPTAVIGMIVLPIPGLDAATLRRHRDALLADRIADVGIADFHPDAPIDLTSPARLVPWLRRSPDPTLQVVGLDTLAAARAAAPPPDLAAQAQILAGRAIRPPRDVSDEIAVDNLRTVEADLDAVIEAVAAIHADRDRRRVT